MASKDPARFNYLSSLVAQKTTSAPIASGQQVLNIANYVVRLKIGTPGQLMNMVLDTSNDIAWAPCSGCTGCSSTTFLPNSSSTYGSLDCSVPECAQARGLSCSTTGSTAANGCFFNQSYGGDSSFSATLVQDALTLANYLVEMVYFLGHVLISSGLSSDASHQNGLTVEGLLLMNLPNGQSSRSHQNSQATCSMQGKNIIVPISILKNPLHEKWHGSRKRRKKCSEAEDLELIAAVEKYGEGNWANILRGDFKGDRTPNQLAQRWKNIRKNNLDLNVGGGSSSKLSEAQLAARDSLSIALNMPNITANTIGTAGTSTHGKLAGTNATSNSLHCTTAEAKPQSQQGLNPVKTYQTGLSGSTTKTPVIAKTIIPNVDANFFLLVLEQNCTYKTNNTLGQGQESHAPMMNSSPLTAATPSTTRPRFSKVLPQVSQHTPTSDAMLSKQTNGVSCNLDAEPGCALADQVQDGAVISRDGPNDRVQNDKSPDQKAQSKNMSTNAENPIDSLKIESDETDSKAVTGVQVKERKSAEHNEIPCSSAMHMFQLFFFWL
ncbi:hypothetical protein D8674_012861 [Pyrus ussuriensis x Pyrus communis]|uniref:Uncharacterized protein n=1 Tax=Pyrus ussuriensis x Pyrus communis TaxID=2448454 RepID=A0A5N5GTJ0_9ROSA|nr:hypothetical protein D8674_012861 [Pyrus ussuriensis x Pyrus communis]